MRGHIIAEEQFLHQGIDHRLFVTAIEGGECEYRFEVLSIAPGADHPESVFEKTEDLSGQLAQCPNTTIDQLINAEIRSIKSAVTSEENLHANDP